MRVYAGWEGGMQRQPSQALRASSPRGGNGDDRRQRRKQGGAVGAAASRMRGPHQGPKQTLGAATRVRSTSGVSVRSMLDELSTMWRKRAGLATEGRPVFVQPLSLTPFDSSPSRGASGETVHFAGTAKASPTRSNGDDRRQWRKQGGAVGAAASRMRAAAKQTLGAATRAVASRQR